MILDFLTQEYYIVNRQQSRLSGSLNSSLRCHSDEAIYNIYFFHVLGSKMALIQKIILLICYKADDTGSLSTNFLCRSDEAIYKKL